MPVEIVAQPPHHLRLGMLARRMTPPARTIARRHRRIRIRKEADILPRRPPADTARTAEDPRCLHRVDKLSIRRRIPRLHLPPRLLNIEWGIECGLHLHYLRCHRNHLYRRHVSILRPDARRRAPVLAVEVRKLCFSVSRESRSGLAGPRGASPQSCPGRFPRSAARANRYTAAPGPTRHR